MTWQRRKLQQRRRRWLRTKLPSTRPSSISLSPRSRRPSTAGVGLRQISPGAMVHANDTVGIITVTQIRPIAVQFSWSQDNLPGRARGQATGEPSVTVAPRDATTLLTTCKLAAIDNQ